MTDYRKLCIELFGTDDETELREIAGKQRSGKKKALSKKDTEAIIEMQQQGKTTKEIAEHFGVSRQTISKYLNKPLNNDYVMRIDFMYKQKICTEIYVDFTHKKIKILNRTKKNQLFINLKTAEKLKSNYNKFWAIPVKEWPYFFVIILFTILFSKKLFFCVKLLFNFAYIKI